MGTTQQQYLSSGSALNVEPGETAFQDTGLMDKDGNSLLADFVRLPSPLIFKRIGVNAGVNGFFCYNPTNELVEAASWLAARIHSIAGQPPVSVLTASLPIAEDSESLTGQPKMTAKYQNLVIDTAISAVLPGLQVPFATYVAGSGYRIADFITKNNDLFIIEEAGLYRVKASLVCKLPQNTADEEITLYLARDPAGAATIMLPALSEQTIGTTGAGESHSRTLEIETQIGILGNEAEILRTFAIFALGSTGNATLGPASTITAFSASLTIERIGDLV